MTRKQKHDGPTDAEIKRLLKRYACPVPFHVVRTRFLGALAAPDPMTPPMQVVAGLWDGELPAFDSTEDANELLSALVMGLWNRLSEHQQRKNPFKLTRLSLPQDGKSLARVAQIRVEELQGFIDGLYGDQEVVELPERAHEALQHLSELHSFMHAYVQFSDDPGLDMQDTQRTLTELTCIAHTEINALVLSCARARRHPQETHSAQAPQLHRARPSEGEPNESKVAVIRFDPG